MTQVVIPLVVLAIICYGLIKGVSIYDVFLEGVKEGLGMALKIFPTMFAMVMSVDILVKSNILNDITMLIELIFNVIKFPKELFPLAIIPSNLIPNILSTFLYPINTSIRYKANIYLTC